MIYVLALLISFHAAGMKIKSFYGEAYDVDTNTLVYTEKHKEFIRDKKLFETNTLYFDAQSKTIAKLNCKYAKSIIAPDCLFQDFRHDYFERVTFKQKSLSVHLKENKESKRYSHKIEGPITLSQGLNQFVKNKRLEIANGDSFVTNFYLPSRDVFIDMKVKKNDSRSDQETISTVIQVSNVFLRIFAPQVEIDYARDDGRIVHYLGNSNILTKDKESQKVRIVYTYEGDK